MAFPTSEWWIGDVTSSNEKQKYVRTRASEMDPTLWCQLADDVLEKIWARLPLKALVRSQVLSRKWNCVFQSSTFQAEVTRVSSQWVSYFPLFYDDGGFRGYDQTCGSWQQLFPFPKSSWSIPNGFTRDCQWWESFCTLTGNVIAFCLYSSNNVLHVQVTNLMCGSKSTRELPPLDLTGDGPLDQWFDESRSKWIVKNRSYVSSHSLPGLEGNCCSVLLLPNNDSRCQVLVFTRNLEHNVIQVRVFHPDVNSWTECKQGPKVPPRFPNLDSCVYLESVCYLCFLEPLDQGFFFNFDRYLKDSMFLCTYKADEGLFGKIVLPPQEQVPDLLIQDCQMVVCGGELLLVACEARLMQCWEQAHPPREGEFDFGNLRTRHYYMSRSVDRAIYEENIYVFRLDLETLQFTEVSRGPPEPLDGWINSGLIVADKDSIYIPTFPAAEHKLRSFSAAAEHETGDKCILTFNLREQMWTWLTLENCPWLVGQSTSCVL